MRALGPPLALLLLWLATLAAVDLAPAPVAGGAMLPYAAVLLLGAAVVHPAMRRRGASVACAAAGALLMPTLWVAKECWAMGRLYTPAEAFYYAFNPVALGVLAVATVQISAAELILRRRRAGRWSFRNGAGLTLAAITLAAALVAVVAWRSGPTAVFWTYVAMHRRLFAGGR